MSHPEQLGFFRLVHEANQTLVDGGAVLEVGSYDVNGSVRTMFAGAREYVGVDLREGPGVDVVAFGHQVDRQDGVFDLTLSGECFEHDPHWSETFSNMARMTRPGGVVAFTCASAGRPEHGTRRTDQHESPGTQAQGLDYYRNLVEADFLSQVDLSTLFDSWAFWYLPTSFDLYFAGVRGGGAPADRGALPNGQAVTALRRLMPVPHRIARLPLAGLRRVLGGARYQAVILPYWRLLLRLQDRVLSGRYRRAGDSVDPHRTHP